MSYANIRSLESEYPFQGTRVRTGLLSQSHRGCRTASELAAEQVLEKEHDSPCAILAVDDNPDNLLVLESLLAGMPAKLVLAASGRDALECLLREDFAVILLDVQMPDMDGLELAYLIRQHPRHQLIPIIFVTATEFDVHQIERGYAYGAVDYLIKPLNSNAVRSKITCFLKLFHQQQLLESVVASQLRDREALQKARDDLAVWVTELKERNRQIALLCEAGQLLQTSVSRGEITEIFRHYLQNVYPAHHGALYLNEAGGEQFELAKAWGPGPQPRAVLTPKECWALRRNRPHWNDQHLVCAHASLAAEASRSLCVPLLAHGKALGLLHLWTEQKEAAQPPSLAASQTESLTQLATTLAEQTALALANLDLREALRNQSIRDVLTGVFNRRYMEESLERELKRAQRSGTPVGIVMLDLDHFKRFNDSFGHLAGDHLLTELGAFLQTQVRGEDIVCRYGGEEFLLILPGASCDDTRARAEHLRGEVKQLGGQANVTTATTVTLSLGVACFPEHGSTIPAIIGAADRAVYAAKAHGRDCVCVA